MQLVPTIHTEKAKRPSTLPTSSLSRKALKQRINQANQNVSFEDKHCIKSFELFELTI